MSDDNSNTSDGPPSSTLHPTEPTTEIISSSPDSAPTTDSAPPPQQAPAPPPRTATAFVETAPPLLPQFRPNSAIPSFLRFLATLIFLGGSIGAASAFIYRTFLYPRLVLSIKALTGLSVKEGERMERFKESVKGLKEGKGHLLLFPPRAVGDVAEEKAEAEKVTEEDEKTPLLKDATEKDAKATPEIAGEPSTTTTTTTEHTESPPIPATRIFTSLATSLQTLAQSFSSLSDSDSEAVPTSIPSQLFATPPSKSSLASSSATTSTPTTSLTNSLTKLNDYLMTETLSGLSSNYSMRINGFPSEVSGGGGRKDVFQEAVGSLKTEIRSVKGALLNRRNFAALAPRAVGE